MAPRNRRNCRRSYAPDGRSCAAAPLHKPVEHGQQRGLIRSLGNKPRPEALPVERGLGGGADRDGGDPPHCLRKPGVVGKSGENRGGARREEQREIDDAGGERPDRRRA